MEQHPVLVPGPPTTGLWCDDCALPSVISGAVLVEGTRTSVGSYSFCTDCDGREDTEPARGRPA